MEELKVRLQPFSRVIPDYPRHLPQRVGYNKGMNIVIFDADAQCREFFGSELAGHNVSYVDERVSLPLLGQCADAEIISVFVPSQVTKECIDALPNLKCIVARSTGIDHIDVKYAASKGISVMNVPRYGSRTVAEFTFALLLALSRRIFDGAFQVREEGSFSTAKLEGFDLYGKTLGVIGTGAIGRTVVSIAHGFGMRVRMYDKFPDSKLESESAQYVSLSELLKEADVITLHVPYVPENHHLLNAAAFSEMKKGVTLINTARGELIDTEALLSALKDGTVAGAALDVLENERFLKDEMELVRGSESIQELKGVVRKHGLLEMPQGLITLHIAFFSKEAYREILASSALDIKGFVGGALVNVIPA